MKKTPVNRQLMLYLREQNPDKVRPAQLPWWAGIMGWAATIAVIAGAVKGFLHGT